MEGNETMSTELQPAPAAVPAEITTPIEFPVSADDIAQKGDEFGQLVIDGVGDSTGLKAVKAAISWCRESRVAVEAHRKALKDPHLKFGRKVDAHAKDLTGKIQSIETPLSGMKNEVEAEKARIKKEKEEAAAKKLQERIDALVAVGGEAIVAHLSVMGDDDFDKLLADATAEHERKQAEEAERQRKEKEEREREEARLAEQRAENERHTAANEAARNALEAKQKKLEDERAAKEAAEQAEREEAERKEREAAEAKRREAMRPYCEKLLALADRVDALDTPEPNLAKEDERRLACEVAEHLEVCANHIRESVKAGGIE